MTIGSAPSDTTAEADPTIEVARAAAAAPVPPGHRATFARMARNIGWLLGGRGFQAVASLGYLALSARALGPVGFGSFTLILAYAQTIATFVTFQSWQSAVRFGALHLADARPDRLGRLFAFTGTLDVAAALIGAVIGVAGVGIAAPWLGWADAERIPAALFAAALLLSTGGTASGMLRLHDRFDLLALAEAIGPLVRLAGATAAWWLDWPIAAFLAVWAGAALLQMAATWACALWIAPYRLRFGRGLTAEARAENPGLLRFLVQTNLAGTVGPLSQLGTLAVGAAAGPAAAGGFRLAGKIAKAAAKPVQTVTLTLYPELARLCSEKRFDIAGTVLRRVTWMALGFAAVLIVVLAFGGQALLGLFGGHDFAFARPLLLAFAVSSAIDIWGFAMEPLHNAMGQAGRVLRVQLVGAAAYVAALIVLLPLIGPIGAAFGAIASSALRRGLLTLSASRLLSEAARTTAGPADSSARSASR